MYRHVFLNKKDKILVKEERKDLALQVVLLCIHLGDIYYLYQINPLILKGIIENWGHTLHCIFRLDNPSKFLLKIRVYAKSDWHLLIPIDAFLHIFVPILAQIYN
eukprot:NODE_572_length_5896_cov_0.685872.p8 type:complete len:105 gc:universal NODE_572_length_5896_cov_0.685872:304-618(+)